MNHDLQPYHFAKFTFNFAPHKPHARLPFVIVLTYPTRNLPPAQELVSKGVDTARAQQFENYANQIELNKVRKESAKLTEMDEVNHIDEDWRTMAKFGVDRVQNFDLTEAFGPVIPDVNDITEVITLKANPNGIAFHTIPFRNPYMGFLDFRAALSDDTPKSWQVEPEEGTGAFSFADGSRYGAATRARSVFTDRCCARLS